MDTLRTTLYAVVRTVGELPADRQALLLQEFVAALPPARDLPLTSSLNLGAVYLDSATVHDRLLPTAGVRFELRRDGRVTDIQPLRNERTWLEPGLDSALVRAARRLSEERTLGAILHELGRASVRVELLLSTSLPQGTAYQPLARLVTPFARADRPATLKAGNPEPTYPRSAEALGAVDTVTLRVAITSYGSVEMGNVSLVSARYRELIEAAHEVLRYYRFHPARRGDCPVRSLRELRFVFRNGRVASDAPLDAEQRALWGPSPSASAYERSSRMPKPDSTIAAGTGSLTSACATTARYATDTTYGTLHASLKLVHPVVPLAPEERKGLLESIRAHLNASIIGYNRLPDSSPPLRGFADTAVEREGVGFTLRRSGEVGGFRYLKGIPGASGIVNALLRAEAQGTWTGVVNGMPGDSVVLAIILSTRPDTDGGSIPLFRFARYVARAQNALTPEKPAMAHESNRPPRYPPAMDFMRLKGEVLVQFVVDTTGLADMRTFRVLRSNDPIFTSAVLEVLPTYRFYPAETGGCKVRMYVQQPFTFHVPGGVSAERTRRTPPPLELPSGQ